MPERAEVKLSAFLPDLIAALQPPRHFSVEIIDLENLPAIHTERITLEQVLTDSTVHDAAGEGGVATRRWKHDAYDVVSRYDSARKSNALLLRDRRGREWNLGTIASSFVQIFWLDKPVVDAKTRSALSNAFNEATEYGGAIKQVARKRQLPKRIPGPGHSRADGRRA